ncbi:YopX family protein [Lacticaseibacillus salsurivasis]|uniref:YopX family protein n=1 Tax=Lacticaseibacillus salsurivasis TaxID=3081441 RepID=UPI0030C6F591
MSLYAVKNDKGNLWDFEDDDDFWNVGDCVCAVTAYQERADSAVKEHGGHVVELIEAPAKVVVSAEEAEMLKEAVKDDNFGAGFISDYVDEHWDDYGDLNRTHIQDRLMRAYVNGWTVEKPKRWRLLNRVYSCTASGMSHKSGRCEMRQIKFRAWDKDSKLMDNVVRLEVDDSGHFDTADGYGNVYHNFELMQFTGLYDKNGRGIYEGDIVRTGDDNVGDPAPMIGKVIMQDGSWLIENEEKQEAIDLFSEITSREVIGNIFEDKQLLEGKHE